MTIALTSHINIPASSTGGTSTAIDTTGATLLVICVAQEDLSAFATPTDFYGNTWTGLTSQSAGAGVGLNDAAARIWYASNPTVGTGHTFGETAHFSACAVLAFSGVATTSPFDKENGAISSTSPVATGSVTPTNSNSLIVTGVSDASTSRSIDSGFTISDQTAFGSGNNYGNAGAYLIQGAAAAVNPQWTIGQNGGGAVVIAVFAPASGAAAATIGESYVILFD